MLANFTGSSVLTTNGKKRDAVAALFLLVALLIHLMTLHIFILGNMPPHHTPSAYDVLR